MIRRRSRGTVAYHDSLGSGPYDAQAIPYEEKANRLVGIYKQVPGCDVVDPILHSLLRSHAVQEFNDQGRFGVHPLIVDILIGHGKLKPGRRKIAPGGTA